ncbi:hypothetical protein BC829DRAFT_434051 [Chytridium lagenaria]|nr:hypothetical protein BC829DRAFT_434051 [Chytridium lagenaria]
MMPSTSLLGLFTRKGASTPSLQEEENDPSMHIKQDSAIDTPTQRLSQLSTQDHTDRMIIPAVKALEEQIRFADISAQQLGLAISNNRSRGSSSTTSRQPSPTSTPPTSVQPSPKNSRASVSSTAKELFKARAELHQANQRAEAAQRQLEKMQQERRQELLQARSLAVGMVGWKSVLDMIALASSSKPRQDASNITSDGLSGTLEALLRDLETPCYEALRPSPLQPDSEDRHEMIQQLLHTLSDSTRDDDIHMRLMECLEIVKTGTDASSTLVGKIKGRVCDIVEENRRGVNENLRMARAAMATVSDGCITPVTEPKSPLSVLEYEEPDGRLSLRFSAGKVSIDRQSEGKMSLEEVRPSSVQQPSQRDSSESVQIINALHNDNLSKLAQLMRDATEFSDALSSPVPAPQKPSLSPDMFPKKPTFRSSTMSALSADTVYTSGRTPKLRRHRLGVIIEKQGDEFVLEREYARVMEVRHRSVQMEGLERLDVNQFRGWNSATGSEFFKAKRCDVGRQATVI